jgi:uncharacterized UPF0160 family protein
MLKRLRPASLELLEARIQATAVSSAAPACAFIATHSGHFHCDEVLACVMLKTLPRYCELPIVRSRDAPTLDKAEIVVDVGGTYDAAKSRFDHHQRGFTETLPQFKTKLSSAGLVYKHFGRDVLRSLAPSLSEAHVDVLYPRVYENYVEHIDGIDNGIEAFEGGSKNYNVSTTLSSRVGSFNPSWNEQGADEMARFKLAMEYVAGEFVLYVNGLVESWIPARRLVEEAVAQCGDVHASGRVLKLSQACPWKDHLLELEKERDMVGTFLYVLYDDGTGVWRIQAVPEDGFKSRKPLAERLCGLRDAELSSAAGIDGAVFVHASGFIGGAKTLQGVLRLAEMSM